MPTVTPPNPRPAPEHLTLVGFTTSHALKISDILQSRGWNPLLRIFDNQRRFVRDPCTLQHPHELLDTLDGTTNCVFALSRPSGKRFMVETFHLAPGRFTNLIHASASVSSYATLGGGLRVDAGAVVGPAVQLGDFVHLKSMAYIGHHAKIGRLATINPSASLAGGAVVGAGATIGLGTRV